MRQSSSTRTILVGLICAVLALMVGTGIGLLITRGINSPRDSRSYTSLGVGDKEEYIVLVGAAYTLDHDLERAQARLYRLEAPNIHQWVASLVARYSAEEWGRAEVRALMELADGLGVQSSAVLAYMSTLTPPLTDMPLPPPTLAPTDMPSATPFLPTEAPTAVPSTATSQPQPTDTPPPPPSDTPIAATPTAQPSDTPVSQPTNTPKPAPSNTPRPTNTPVAKWAWTARLVSPGQEGQTCSDGLKLIRVTVLDAAGNQIPGVWVYEHYTNQYLVSGHKGDDPFWGPGEVEIIGLDGGRVCVASGEGGACETELTRDLPCHDPPPFEDLWAAGYCECCEPEITKERCQELFDSGNCLGISHYMWRVEFRRSW